MDWVDRLQNFKDLYGILQLLGGSNFPLKTFKIVWVTFHSVTFQLKCLDFQSNQYNKLVPVLSRLCEGLYPNISYYYFSRRVMVKMLILNICKIQSGVKWSLAKEAAEQNLVSGLKRDIPTFATVLYYLPLYSNWSSLRPKY